MSEQVFTSVDMDTVFESASKKYVPAPVGKLLKFHVVEPEQTEQINKFKTTPDGKENPEFGKPQPVLIFKAMLDEGVAKGQVYSSWITGYYKDGKASYSFGPKSKFGKIAEALCGSVDEFQKLKVADIIGLPFQCALINGTKEPVKQMLNIDKILPPSEDQVRVEAQGDQTNIEDPEAILQEAGLL